MPASLHLAAMFSCARRSGRPWWPASLLVAVLAAIGWAAGPASAATLGRALDHLAAVQDPRGGGFAEGRGTDPTITPWAALAIAAAPGQWAGKEAPLRRALVRTLGRRRSPTPSTAAVALAASGIDPRAVAGRDLVREILAAQRSDGTIGADPSSTAWGILALRAGRLAPEARAVARGPRRAGADPAARRGLGPWRRARRARGPTRPPTPCRPWWRPGAPRGRRP